MRSTIEQFTEDIIEVSDDQVIYLHDEEIGNANVDLIAKRLIDKGYGNLKDFADALKKKAITRHRIDGKPFKVVAVEDINETLKDLLL